MCSFVEINKVLINWLQNKSDANQNHKMYGEACFQFRMKWGRRNQVGYQAEDNNEDECKGLKFTTINRENKKMSPHDRPLNNL